MPRALVNGINIHYQCAGQGPTVVLIHGLATSLAFWYLAIFWALRKDFRVIVYDLRGHGNSDMPLRGYTSADMAADLEALLDHLNVKRVHLVGHSFGGAVALHHTVLHPERVASLTLADARVLAFRPVQTVNARHYRKIWKKNPQELGMPVPEAELEMGLSLLEEVAYVNPAARKRVSNGNPFAPFQLWNGNKQTAERWGLLWHTTTIREDINAVAGLTLKAIRHVNQPTLATFGQRSRFLVTCPALRETLPQCRVVVVPGAGHFHPLRKPAIFVRHLREFLMGLEVGD